MAQQTLIETYCVPVTILDNEATVLMRLQERQDPWFIYSRSLTNIISFNVISL